MITATVLHQEKRLLLPINRSRFKQKHPLSSQNHAVGAGRASRERGGVCLCKSLNSLSSRPDADCFKHSQDLPEERGLAMRHECRKHKP